GSIDGGVYTRPLDENKAIVSGVDRAENFVFWTDSVSIKNNRIEIPTSMLNMNLGGAGSDKIEVRATQQNQKNRGGVAWASPILDTTLALVLPSGSWELSLWLHNDNSHLQFSHTEMTLQKGESRTWDGSDKLFNLESPVSNTCVVLGDSLSLVGKGGLESVVFPILSATLLYNDLTSPISLVVDSNNADYRASKEIVSEGKYELEVKRCENSSCERINRFVYGDSSKPSISWNAPSGSVNQSSFALSMILKDSVSNVASVKVSNQSVYPFDDSTYNMNVSLSQEINTFNVQIIDLCGNTKDSIFSIQRIKKDVRAAISGCPTSNKVITSSSVIQLIDIGRDTVINRQVNWVSKGQTLGTSSSLAVTGASGINKIDLVAFSDLGQKDTAQCSFVVGQGVWQNSSCTNLTNACIESPAYDNLVGDEESVFSKVILGLDSAGTSLYGGIELCGDSTAQFRTAKIIAWNSDGDSLTGDAFGMNHRIVFDHLIMNIDSSWSTQADHFTYQTNRWVFEKSVSSISVGSTGFVANSGLHILEFEIPGLSQVATDFKFMVYEPGHILESSVNELGLLKLKVNADGDLSDWRKYVW
ncbi:hypothetical protein OAA91_00940, partial [Fibrobacterales bacterium]|nr:hypothetical protein [Fibrobacterales bacterium]